MTEPIQIDSRAELLKIRTYLHARGFRASVQEITEHLRTLEEASQPDLFSGPMFEKKNNER